MNRRSFLALAASPLLAPLLAACKSPLPAEKPSLHRILSEDIGGSPYLAQKRWWSPVDELRSRWIPPEEFLVDPIYRGPGLWAECDNERPIPPEEYPEMRELLGPDLTLDDNGVIVLKETP